MNNLFRSILFLFVLSTTGYAQTLPDNYDISVSSNGIIDLPANAPAIFATEGFVRYTKIQCPNGEAIHFVAQNQITDAQIIYARTILEFYLKDYEGSEFGSDKSGVINTMGTNNATLVLVNGTHSEGNEPNIAAQPLYQNEMAVPGHEWYQQNNYERRCAAFEEILHMMHDMGIGVDGPNSISNPALPAYQTEIRAAQDNADNNNYQIWPLTAGANPGWYNELSAENSLSQEYLAAVIDSYYGLWEPWTDDPNTGMWGEYIAHNREEIETEDSMGYALMPKYFSPLINVDMITDPSFNGIFSLTENSANPYTYKSQYLQHVYLTGTNPSGLQGNDAYNRLRGNEANNSFEGLKGNDRLDGYSGVNTAIFTGNQSDYTVQNLSDYAIITDNVTDRDGVDTLWNMDSLQFSDITVYIELNNTTGLIENTSQKEFKIYPNPSNDFIQIATDSAFDSIEIVDLTGKKVLTSNTKSIDVSSLSTGAYIVYLVLNERRSYQRFVKN